MTRLSTPGSRAEAIWCAVREQPSYARGVDALGNQEVYNLFETYELNVIPFLIN